MNILKQINDRHKITAVDINEHLGTILKYASECEHVTEFGIRDGSSLSSILLANPKKVNAYDIKLSVFSLIEEYKKYAIDNNIDFNVYEADVLSINIEETDMLFIDTLHTYNQLKKELEIHAKKVKKYIIFHDVVTFGHQDELIYSHASDIIKSQPKEKQGLMTAINEFLDNDKSFKIKEMFTNNNGLLVLEKI